MACEPHLELTPVKPGPWPLAPDDWPLTPLDDKLWPLNPGSWSLTPGPWPLWPLSHITPHHITSHHTIPHHITSHHSHHTKSHRITSHHPLATQDKYSGSVAVAATDNSLVPASFTNFGDWVDVAAPGVDILAGSGEVQDSGSGTTTFGS